MGKTDATGWHLRNDSCGIVFAWLGRIGGYALVLGIFAIVRGVMLLIYALGAPAATATPS